MAAVPGAAGTLSRRLRVFYAFDPCNAQFAVASDWLCNENEILIKTIVINRQI